ncbi:MAG: hypothetical protein Kow00108_07410 [Calditrichia bacterium]
MESISWQEEYELGIPALDEQHKKLIQLLKLLEISMRNQSDLETEFSILSEFIQLALFHFSYEQKYLRDIGYPRYQEHKGHHEKLIVQLKFIQGELMSGNLKTDAKLFAYLKDWLTIHLMEDDQDVAGWYRETMDKKHL